MVNNLLLNQLNVYAISEEDALTVMLHSGGITPFWLMRFPLNGLIRLHNVFVKDIRRFDEGEVKNLQIKFKVESVYEVRNSFPWFDLTYKNEFIPGTPVDTDFILHLELKNYRYSFPLGPYPTWILLWSNPITNTIDSLSRDFRLDF